MTPAPGPVRYRDTTHRLLVDMHIPDWDEELLGRYDPASIAAAAEITGAEGVMLYFQSHLGLCYYLTQVGVRHAAAAQRDLAGEALAALSELGIPVCAYYSVNFNNRAWLDHPDWRLEPAAPTSIGVLPRERYGIVCLNNPDYRSFVDAQVDELVAYPADAFFFDMVWWNGICTCRSCRLRYRDEANAEIPETVDWRSPEWVRFQSARERWLAELAGSLRDYVRRSRPDADVYHNFALGLSNWTRGVTFDSVAGHDFLGGDFYGGRAEQLLVTRLMLNLTLNRPAEFMTTVATGLTEHTGLRSAAAIETKAFAALMADAAFLAIVGIDPDGTIDREALDRVRCAFDASRPYSAFTGGRPIEQVGLYCSDLSKMDAREQSRPITATPAASVPDYPHFHSLVGASRILQQAHIPFGVVTRANLQELRRWPVLVLPNVQRMAPEEISAIRDYVREGGHLYASRDTSLMGTEGEEITDFALADLFGCSYEGEEEGRLVYARATGWPEPQRPLAHWRGGERKTGTLRIRGKGGEPLVSLTVPYGHPHPGTLSDTNWASIHSSPPWRDTERPLVLRTPYGSGLSIYSALDIEAGQTAEHDALFLSLLRALYREVPAVEAETHPQVWLSAFEQENRIAVLLLNYAPEPPALPVPSAVVRVRLPAGRHCKAVLRAPGLAAIPHHVPEPGVVEFEGGPVESFALHLVELANAAG